MSAPARLDRLSALLQGLAPQFELASPAREAVTLLDTPAEQTLLLYLLTEGTARVAAPGRAEERVAGPVVVVCRADPQTVVEALDVAAQAGLVCIRARFAGPVGPLLLEEFGAALIVPLDGCDGALQSIVQLIAAEIAAPRCGQPVLLERAGDILFIGLLRHLIAHPRTDGGLFSGLADVRIARALVSMHAAPEQGWTLERLADEAGMSRTAFANRFRDLLRCPPGAYLNRLRLAIARRAIEGGAGLKRAASLSGYSGAATLSRALAQAARRASPQLPLQAPPLSSASLR